jgi:gliding motility-associated-like protein
MKKSLLIVFLLALFQTGKADGQVLTISPDSMFFAPDTVCINQPVTLVPDSSIYHASSYYWGFCSGYLLNTPTGENLGNYFGFHIPTNIDIRYDSGNYYGFVINSQTQELLRLNYGNSLSNTPTVTNFGNLDNGLPKHPTSLYIVQDTISRNWFIFVCGGFDTAEATLGRVDFGRYLSNPHPNVANFGNYNNMLGYPTGLFVAQDASNFWYGYLVDHNTNHLIRLDFSYNVSNTPQMFDYGNVGSLLSFPTDMAAVFDHGNWYLFITNGGVASDVTRIDLGPTLDPSTSTIASTVIGEATYPAGAPPGEINSFDYRINAPSSITITRDCGNLYAYITDSTTAQLIEIEMTTVTGPYKGYDYNNVGAMNYPSSISSILRSGDNLYGFISNSYDSTLTRIDFKQCHSSTIPSYSEIVPPVYEYDTPGVYNVYLVVNQGMPNMRVDCKTIAVLPYPTIAMNTDTTICEGDTVRLYAISNSADSIRWQTGYNIDTTYLFRDSVRVFPAYSANYPVTLYYPNGCIVDTSVHVNVSVVHADAGPDRTIKDGSSTILGGVYSSAFDTMNYKRYAYVWHPYNFLSDTTSPFPSANPPYDFTYYLTVTELNDTFKCMANDTVVVHVDCGDVYLPNAFSPNSESIQVATFGILNNEVIKLNYFRIFDRWGVEVFETSDPTQRWDGTYNGKAAPEGVYVWEADIFCTSGKEYHKSGNVSLLR